MLHFFARRMKEAREDERGFTLIELLVVVIIIGILAAIAIPTFLGQRAKAQDASAKSLVRNGQTAVESVYVDEQKYTTVTDAKLKAVDPSTDFTTTGTAAVGKVDYSGAADATTAAPAGGYTLQSKSDSGKTAKLVKDPVSGKVTITVS